MAGGAASAWLLGFPLRKEQDVHGPGPARRAESHQQGTGACLTLLILRGFAICPAWNLRCYEQHSRWCQEGAWLWSLEGLGAASRPWPCRTWRGVVWGLVWGLERGFEQCVCCPSLTSLRRGSW